MMISKITKKQTFYWIQIQDAEYRISHDLFYRYNLKMNETISQSQLNQLLKEQTMSDCREEALKKLSKMQSVQSLKVGLIQKGYEISVIEKVILEMIEKKYLDDRLYVETYIMQKKDKEGPLMITEKMNAQGVDPSITRKALEKINESAIIEKRVIAFLNSVKNSTQRQAKSRIRQKLISQGFSMERVESTIHKNMVKYTFDEETLIKKQYQLYLKKYEKKYEGYELTQRIKNKLYEKGFSKEAINHIIEGS
jgi:regulatory protein